MHRNSTCAIAVMAKAPQAGRSKTRLCPPVRPDHAAWLSEGFLRDMFLNIARASGEAPIAGYSAYAPAGCEALMRTFLPPGMSLILADGTPPMPPGVEGFGRCLLHALRSLFDLGHGAACVLNSDSPTLPTSCLVEAARTLLADGSDRIVLGPAEDGGYYLLGMREAHERLFADIAWSTGSVADATRHRAASLGLQVVELPMWYDVDDAASLLRLMLEIGAGVPEAFAAPATQSALRRVGLVAMPAAAE